MSARALRTSARGAVAVAVAFAATAGCASERAAQPRIESAPLASCTPATSNKALVLRVYDELWAKKDPDAALRVFAPNLVNHAAIPQAQGAEGMRTIAKKLLAAFPDLAIHVDDVVADGDRVVLRVTFEGTHTGRLDFVKTPLDATGKHVKVEQVVTFRVANGAIVESWMTMDHLELMKQLGVLPGGPPAPRDGARE